MTTTERVGLLPLVEAFGKTIQGEGPAAGTCASFLRLGGCNLSCSWCDTPYSWDAARFNLREQITMTSVDDIIAAVPPAPVCVITGGEPLLNQNHIEWEYLLAGLDGAGFKLHLETNGTLPPSEATTEWFDLICVSPKQPHAGRHKRSQDPTMQEVWAYVPQAHLKIVVQTAEDVWAAAAFAEEHDWPFRRVWVMPEGTTPEVLQSRWPRVAATAAAAGINATHRLHVLAWNDERGH